jgi:formylmethanofuran dehydrogenase subunit E
MFFPAPRHGRRSRQPLEFGKERTTWKSRKRSRISRDWPRAWSLDTETKEGKILTKIIDILDDIALELEDMQDEQQELGDGLDAVSDDLEDVEDVVFGDEEDEDEDEEDDDSEDCYATTCPNCGETVYFDDSILEDGEVVCPNCGEKLEFDPSDVEEAEDESTPDGDDKE